MKSEKVALTPQQQEVLRLYKAKVPTRQIAALLNVSVQRIYQHRDRLRELGVLP